jgi:hypothetical protein
MLTLTTQGRGSGVTFNTTSGPKSMRATPAEFGPAFADLEFKSGVGVVWTEPKDACAPITNAAALQGAVALIERGTCEFLSKAFRAQIAGAVLAVVINDQAGPTDVMFTDDGVDTTNVTITAVMVTAADGRALSEGGVGGVTATYPVPLVDPEDDEGHMSAFSSHGPTNDMRRKPGLSLLNLL